MTLWDRIGPSTGTIILLLIALGVLILPPIYFIRTGYNEIMGYIFAILVTIIALGISLLSDWKMSTIARADILGVIRAIGRVRFNFYNKMYRYEYEFSELKKEKNLNEKERVKKIGDLKFKFIQLLEIVTWETILCLRQANVMKRWAQKKDKDDIAYRVKILADNVFSYISMGIVINRHIRYLLICCQELSKLEISEVWKTKLICLFQENNVGKMKPSDKNFEGYIERKLEQIGIDPTGKLSGEQFMGILFEGMK